MQLHQTIIKFPEIVLKTRDAHKLRGYFGNFFKEHSPLLHNHFEDGSLRYAYPLVQYKVIGHTPYLVGLAEGAKLLIELFLKIKQIDLEGEHYPILSKNITNKIFELNDTNEFFEYRFITLWMALNENNYRKYIKNSQEEKGKLLRTILTGNILSFYKGIGYWTKQEILLKTRLEERKTKFKDQSMIAFNGSFFCNAILPDYIGLGKAVSRGFGTIIRN